MRFHIEHPSPGILTQDEVWTERLVSVRNGGSGDAEKVYLTVFLPGGRLTRFARVVSTEAYSKVQPELQNTTVLLYLWIG